MRGLHPHLNPPPSRGRRRGMDSHFHGNDRDRRTCSPSYIWDGSDKSNP